MTNTTTPSIIARVNELIDLTRQKRELEARVKAINGHIADLEAELKEAFTAEGVQSIKGQGGTAYLNRQLYSALNKDIPDVVDRLKATDWAWLVNENVNAQTLSAEVRGLERDDNDIPILPKEVKELVNVAEVFRIGVRLS